jgi:hypothetical protein
MVDPPDPDPPAPDRPGPDPFAGTRTGRRLRALAAHGIDEDEQLRDWGRAWVSRDGRFHLLAARTRDFVVLTDRRLALWSCGFFTRQPRRKVFDQQLDRLVVDDIGKRPLRSMRVTGFQRRPLRFDMGSDTSSRAIAAALVGVPPPEGDTCPS